MALVPLKALVQRHNPFDGQIPEVATGFVFEAEGHFSLERSFPAPFHLIEP